MDVYLGIGTNLGDKEENIFTCLQLLEDRVGQVVRCSKYFYSQAQGFDSTNDFVNVVVCVETTLEPLDLLYVTQSIEKAMGRKQKTVQLANGQLVHYDRIIDIDILYYGDMMQTFYNTCGEAILVVPHPRIAERDFVRIPYQEICK